ncbi:MAG: TetR/AcrR family transcriptional regulator [Alphaproteobacteria bacterium]|nr:TetR/AcrR family transcriptional regulator [Alphaproteobacteria bacterium]
MKKTKQEAEETKKAILQSALDLFYEKGYFKTTFELISSKIGMTKGAVYWYFRNKPELVAAIINDYIERKKQYLNEKVPALNHFKDIVAYFSATADFLLSDENACKTAFFLSLQMEWSQSTITKVLEGIRENATYWSEYFTKALIKMQKNGEIRSDINAELLSAMMFNLWTGHVEAYLSKRCPTDLKCMVQKSFDIMFNGLILKKE